MTSFLALFCVLIVANAGGASADPAGSDANVLSKDCSRYLDSDLFDANTYRRYNRDLAGQTDLLKLQRHWCEHGLMEGRQASELFWSREYLYMNPVLASTFGRDNFKSMADTFLNSRKSPNTSFETGVRFGAEPFFNFADYVKYNPDKSFVSADDARRDFLKNGLRAGLRGSKRFSVSEYFNLYPELLSKCRDGFATDYQCGARHYRDVGISSKFQGVLNESFTSWAAVASQSVVSPVKGKTGDLIERWTGADTRAINAVVQAPMPAANAPTLILRSVANGVDARPIFESKLREAKSLGAGVLSVEKGTYVFDSVNSDLSAPAHLLIRGLKDITINGNGSRLVFKKNERGILIKSSVRVKLRNFIIDYDLRSTSLGTITVGPDKTKRLVIDPGYPVNANDSLSQLQEFDRNNNIWALGRAAERLIIPKHTVGKGPYKFVGHQTYESHLFQNLRAGSSFTVIHPWYGGAAVSTLDFRKDNPSEDIWLDDMTIYSAPGMGIVPYGIKRGFAVTNCRLTSKPGSVMGVAWDAIHLIGVGGDTIIKNNVLTRQGDDAINLNSPVSPITHLDPSGLKATISRYTEFLLAGDQVAFFDDEGEFLGTAVIKKIEHFVSGPDYDLVLDRKLNQRATVVRNLAMSNSRTAIIGNKIDHYSILVQTPNTLIRGNRIQDSMSGIRLVANLGYFKEGVGAFNTVVEQNDLENIGFTQSDSLVPWAGVVAVGRIENGYAGGLVQRSVAIKNNKFRHLRQGCISVLNVQYAWLSGNSCEDANIQSPDNSSILIDRSKSVFSDSH
ncbi:MAG: hypothetical protein EOP06_01195 [Proteobacteria bacterium]|nr:MAG: hypothetical protein EOP06_01195 [Pseudomonadota bacterium]